MKLSYNQVTAIETAAHSQYECELGILLHNGRLTSSCFGEILKRQATIDPTRLVIDIMGYTGPLDGLLPTFQLGKENEANAKQCYLQSSQANLIVQLTGLTIFQTKAFWGIR